MVSILKGLFGKRELTDSELYTYYTKSGKTVKDFEKYIMNIKEGKESIALKEICGIQFSKKNEFSELDELIEILEKNNVDKGISLSTVRDKKKLYGIYNQLKAISHIHKNFLKNDDGLINFIYSNKLELFSYLRKKYEENTNKDQLFLNFIYDKYFNQQNYLVALEYFLLKDFGNNIKFLLPNSNNYMQLQLKEAIPIYINLTDIFYNLKNENDETNKINNLFLNLIIYFYTTHNDDLISKNLDRYIQKTECIEIILSLYRLAKKTDATINLEDFVKNRNLVKIFKKISLVDYKDFTLIFTNIMSNVKEYSNIYKGLKYLPLEIIRDMIISKAKYDFITKGIDIIINSNEYNNTAVFNFILKCLFDYYCYNKLSLKQMSKIINFLSKYNSNYNYLTNQIDSLLEVCSIFESKFVTFLTNELVNDDMSDISKNNKYISTFIDYLNNIAESCIQYNEYNFIDKNIIDLNKLITYKKGLTFGKILTYYFDVHENKRPLILNVITSNKAIILNQNEIKSLIDLYLLNPYLIKVESYSFIEDYLDDYNNPLTSEIKIKLENLLEYLKIKLYIKKYKIDDSYFKEYTLDNYSDHIVEILNLLLIKTTNLDNITNIKTFLSSQKSKDIQTSLRLSPNKYNYYLFRILLEYQKVELSNEILDLLLKNDDIKYFNKCMDFTYNQYCKKSNEKFKEYCKNAEIEEYLLDNNNKYLDILIVNDDFSKEVKIDFPKEKKSNDILMLYSLIKNKKFKKEEEKKSCNDLIISFDKFNNIPPQNKNLENLIDCYYKDQQDEDSGNSRINYNYSLHPKLVGLLKTKKYFNLFQDLTITFKSKIKIYNFCLKNKVCSLNDIINNYETIKLKQKAKTDKEIVEKYKLLFNLYKEKDEKNNDVYKELLNYTKSSYNNEQNQKNALLLIDFNLSNKLYISYDNLIFLNVFFGYNISSSNEKELKLLQLLSSSNNKINILPFCSDYNNTYLNDKKYQNIIEKYYRNNLIISLKENNAYFEELKSKNLDTYPNIYYQSIELFNILNMGNVYNIRNIFEHLNEMNAIKININFLFALKISMNFLLTNCILSNKINYGLNNIFGIFNSLNIDMSDIDILLKEIFFFQSVSYVNSSNHNILLFRQNSQTFIKNYIDAKMALVEGMIKMYYNEKITNNLLFSAYKIFLVKNNIIKEIENSEVLNMYNTLKNLDNYSDIIDEIKDNEKLKEKIYEIYIKN